MPPGQAEPSNLSRIASKSTAPRPLATKAARKLAPLQSQSDLSDGRFATAGGQNDGESNFDGTHGRFYLIHPYLIP